MHVYKKYYYFLKALNGLFQLEILLDKNCKSDLSKHEWKRVRKEGASPQDITDFVWQALKVSTKRIFLFGSQDEDYHSFTV